MANVYEALQRGRQEAAPIAPALPRVAKPSPAIFGLEMRTLSSRLQPLFDDRKPVTLGVTASASGEGASTVARELAYHIAAEGKSVLYCGDPADLDAVRLAGGGETVAQSRAMAETSRRGLTLVDIADLHRKDSGFASKAAFREWLDTNAGDLINFLELVNPRADTYPDIKDIREKLAAAPDEYVTELASALRMYQAASAQLPNWLLSSLAKLARSVLRAQGLDFPT